MHRAVSLKHPVWSVRYWWSPHWLFAISS